MLAHVDECMFVWVILLIAQKLPWGRRICVQDRIVIGRADGGKKTENKKQPLPLRLIFIYWMKSRGGQIKAGRSEVAVVHFIEKFL